MVRWRRRAGQHQDGVLGLLRLVSAFVVLPLSSACPNQCSGHGFCLSDPLECECYQGFSGADCSIRVCPGGRSWADIPSATDVAHTPLVECSDMGTCNRKTGECSCRYGFEGAACERLMCPISGKGEICHGHGTCMSMREAARSVDYLRLFHQTTYTNWDADMIYGCVCEQGYTGYDCSDYECPRATDPAVDTALYEEQLIDCHCIGCSGYFKLTFRGQTTSVIPYHATAEFVKYRLQELSSVEHVTVTMNGDLHVCSDQGTVTRVRFNVPGGTDLPSMTISYDRLTSSNATHHLHIRSKGANSSILWYEESYQATKANAECAGRGTCDRTTGLCSCLWDGLFPSDRMLGPGWNRDCGYMNASDPVSACAVATPLWGYYNTYATCSGAGWCNSTDYTCECKSGYTGVACELADCPSSRAWFDEAVAPDDAHALSTPCSNMGACSKFTGKCTCDTTYGNFVGDDCGMLDCAWSYSPWTKKDGRCGDKGQCVTMAQAASLTTDDYGMPMHNVTYNSSWEAHMVQMCACDEPYSVDNQGYVQNRNYTYRGPYAYATTAWKAYDCSLARCPAGDYWRTPGLNEVQRINCTATDGSFRLSFRGSWSDPISFNATEDVLRKRIEQTLWISKIDVRYNSLPSSACDNKACEGVCAPDNIVDLEFLTEFGELPLMITDAKYLGGTVNITRHVKGSRDHFECSRLGTCDEISGRCDCLEGFSSSSGKEVYSTDGQEARGHRGDCGWRNPQSTAPYTMGGIKTKKQSAMTCDYRDDQGKCMSLADATATKFYVIESRGKRKKTS